MENQKTIQNRIEEMITSERGYLSIEDKVPYQGELGVQTKLAGMDFEENKISHYEYLGFSYAVELTFREFKDSGIPLKLIPNVEILKDISRLIIQSKLNNRNLCF